MRKVGRVALKLPKSQTKEGFCHSKWQTTFILEGSCLNYTIFKSIIRWWVGAFSQANTKDKEMTLHTCKIIEDRTAFLVMHGQVVMLTTTCSNN